MKKTSNYYGTYMRVLQETQKENQWLLWKLYAGIAGNVIKPNENHGPICGYCSE